MRPLMFAVMFIAVGFVYHHAGANDWFAPDTFPEDLTQQQIANEITANMMFTAAVIICALMPVKSKEA